MRNIVGLILAFTLTGTMVIPENSPSLWRKADKNIERIFKGQLIARKSITLNDKQLADIGDQFVSKGIYQLLVEEKPVGYLVLATSMGRFESFDYMIVYTTELVVKEINILNYTSSHGGEVASPRWLKQFIGYSGKHLKYGSDIDAISGATISAISLTKDIESITVFMKKNFKES
jgi:hypothetical protein